LHGDATPDLYRVKNEAKTLNPFACLAFPVSTPSKKALKCPSFGDELLTSFSIRQRPPESQFRVFLYRPSVNSREDLKSKCPIWCRLRKIGSHFSFFSCTNTCTHIYDVRMGGHRSTIRLVEVADPTGTTSEGTLGQSDVTIQRVACFAKSDGLLPSGPSLGILPFRPTVAATSHLSPAARFGRFKSSADTF
jgi:hypothetical protein